MIWILLAPTKIGGQTSYVIIHGNSMEPKFHTGDLAIVRKASSYQVGDIVAYWNDSMAAYTIHRIIDTRQDRFIMKGDNNSWIDPIQPGQEEIIGKLWIYLPKVGKTVEWLRSPINFALILALTGGALMTGMAFKSKGNRKKELVNMNPTGILGVALYGFGLLFFAFLALLFYAFSRPVTIASNDILYQQDGLFSYSATGTPGIYDTDTVQPGEPIFPKLTCLLNVAFSYNLLGNQVQSFSGRQQFYAQVLDEQSGWQRTIPMGQVSAFSGTSFFNTGTIDLCQVEGLVTTLEQETGLRSSTYTMEVVSAVSIMGNVAGEMITDSFTPVLAFKFDETHFYLEANGKNNDVLHASKPGLSSSTNLQANILPLLGMEPTVQTVRIAVIIGMVFSLCGLLVIGLYTYSVVRQDQETLIRLKYGSLLADVYEVTYEPTPPIIDVTSIDNLAKLAERHNTMILHVSHDFLHDYLVQGRRATYRFSIGTGTNRSVGHALVQPETLGVASDVDQSQFIGVQQSCQGLEYWGEIYSDYGLEDTQPTRTAQRSYVNHTDNNDMVYNEPDRTIYLGKVKL